VATAATYPTREGEEAPKLPPRPPSAPAEPPRPPPSPFTPPPKCRFTSKQVGAGGGPGPQSPGPLGLVGSSATSSAREEVFAWQIVRDCCIADVAIGNGAPCVTLHAVLYAAALLLVGAAVGTSLVALTAAARRSAATRRAAAALDGSRNGLLSVGQGEDQTGGDRRPLDVDSQSQGGDGEGAASRASGAAAVTRSRRDVEAAAGAGGQQGVRGGAGGSGDELEEPLLPSGSRQS